MITYCCSAVYVSAAILELQLGSGMLLGVPIPEQYAADSVAMETAIESALADAQ
jgi:pseudouridine-5'-phosphate glycosidase